MSSRQVIETSTPQTPKLSRKLNLFDTTMVVMGGIIGSGIFINPYVVAKQVHTPALILGAWAMGGVIALIGAFIYAELAARRPDVGGQYAYLREAFHPSIAFIYGWTLLLVIQTGGMAAVAVTFSRYFIEITGVPLKDWMIATMALGALTFINCLGVRAGSTVQSILMVMKILAIAALIGIGLLTDSSPSTANLQALTDSKQSVDSSLLISFGAAMIPVLFAYGGWQTSSFIAGEINEPRKNLPRGLLIGVSGVVLLYLSVNYICIRTLGPEGLANTTTPASEVMKLALGQTGGRLIAVAIAISTLGFLSQGMLTAPRVYFAMAADGLFFKSVARLDPHRQVPAVAIALQGLFAIVIALTGRYEQILNYVVSADFIFYGLTAACIFLFRRRSRQLNNIEQEGFKIPGHPWTTAFFVLACWIIVITTIYSYPTNSLIGIGIMLLGIPVYLFWRWRNINEQ
jgi:basic amino acid/polyamine antiporter, APA family